MSGFLDIQETCSTNLSIILNYLPNIILN